jgi:hypothetical protein
MWPYQSASSRICLGYGIMRDGMITGLTNRFWSRSGLIQPIGVMTLVADATGEQNHANRFLAFYLSLEPRHL